MYNKNPKQSTQFIHSPHNSFQDIRSVNLKNHLCHCMEKVNQIVVEYCAKKLIHMFSLHRNKKRTVEEQRDFV